jgi:hypothetical protein
VEYELEPIPLAAASVAAAQPESPKVSETAPDSEWESDVRAMMKRLGGRDATTRALAEQLLRMSQPKR